MAANCRIKCFHWQLFALSTLSFSVSIENFFFNAVVFVKNVLLNCKMFDLEKILECGSGESKTAKLVEDIASEYSVEVQAFKRTLSISTQDYLPSSTYSSHFYGYLFLLLSNYS